MNKVILSNVRLTADIDLQTTNSGIEYCQFNVACDRKTGKDSEKITDFIPCKAWRKTAVFLEQYFNKGKLITIEGAFNIDKYVDKDGNNKSFTYVNVNNVEFCGNKSDNSGSSYVAPVAKPSGIDAIETDAAPTFNADDDLPF